ncbi:MAG: AAA family ATPase [Candidatus Shapirobacteria bacterium]
MYLKRLAIINYKSCRNLVLDFKKNLPNTFIGKTDAGKTTVLNGIGLLLNDKSFPNLVKEGQLSSDLSTTVVSDQEFREVFDKLKMPQFTNNNKDSVIVIGVFQKQEGDLEEEFNETASNHLKWSVESHSGEEITVLKQFNEQSPAGKYFICVKDKKDDPLELWNKNQTILKNHRKKLGVTDQEIKNVNEAGRYKNIEVFQAIYNKLDTASSWAEFADFTKKDRVFFPTYKFIDWKVITLKGIEELAQDAVSRVLEEFDEKIRDQTEILSSNATKKVNQELQAKFDKIKSELANIKSINARVYYEPRKTVSEITVEKNTSDGNVRLESQGEGIKKRIGFAFIRFAALENLDKKVKSKKHIWAFDEPEIHLYPPEKREFYEIIKQLSKGVFQTFISTHSTVFVDKSQLNTIRQVQLKDKYTEVSTCSSVSDVHSSLGIKNSDFLFYDTFISGEGDSEKILLPYFYKLYFGKSLEEDSIQIINLGGKSFWKKNKKLFEQMLKDFKNPDDCVFYVLDKDTNAQGDNVYLVGTNDLEDSIDDKFWIELVKDACGLNLEISDLQIIRTQLNTDADKKFHKLLSDKVASTPTRTAYLPCKKDCATYMGRYIKNKNDIPDDIVKLFKNL